MVFTFELHDIDGNRVDPMKVRKFELTEFKDIIRKYQQDLYATGAWNSLYLGNHDQARCVTRFANDAPEFRARSAKLLATLHNTLCGTVYVYQ
jgi:glycosidase